MRKVALFVKGQAESIFIRDFLLKWYEYDADELGFECFTLVSNDLYPTNYVWGSKNSANYYQIINVNNDNAVIGRIVENSSQLIKRGFELIVGLRDMYSPQYRTLAKDHRIHQELNEKFIESSNKVVTECPYPCHISIHFAIMEVEAWMIGLMKFVDDDPETTVFHPAHLLDSFLKQKGRRYDKKEGEVESICGLFAKEDYIKLMESGKCLSFKKFVGSLLG